MRQAVLTDKETFELRDAPIPEVKSGEALLRIRAVGICGSDLHAYHGKHPFISFPIVPGHETTGVVEKIAPDVTSVKSGDRVVLRPQIVCGVCPRCRQGRFNICDKLVVLGCQDTGACSDYFSVRADLLYALPDAVSFAAGTVIEPLAVGVHAVRRGLGDASGKNVLVIGGGTIGNLVAQSAKRMGAARVLLTDVSDFRLGIAKKCGIDDVINTGREDLGQAVSSLLGGEEIDAVFECSANPRALDQVLNVAPKGTTVVIVGVFGNQAPVNLANVQDREYSLIGTLMYLHEDYQEAIALAAKGAVNLEALITNVLDLSEIGKAFALCDTDREHVQKVVLEMK